MSCVLKRVFWVFLSRRPRRTSGVIGNAIFPLPSLFPSADDDDVFFMSSDSDIILSPVKTATPTSESSHYAPLRELLSSVVAILSHWPSGFHSF